MKRELELVGTVLSVVVEMHHYGLAFFLNPTLIFSAQLSIDLHLL